VEDQTLSQMIIIIVGAFAGLFPALLTWATSWFEKRSLAAKQNRALDMARRQIEFIDDWVKVQEGLTTTERFEAIKKEASQELDNLQKSLSEQLTEEREKKEEEVEEKNLLQRLFLAYWPSSVAGWVWHTLFYMFLSITVLILLTAFGIDPETNQFSIETLQEDIIMVLVLLVLPMLFIRWLAIRTDRKEEEKRDALNESKP